MPGATDGCFAETTAIHLATKSTHHAEVFISGCPWGKVERNSKAAAVVLLRTCIDGATFILLKWVVSRSLLFSGGAGFYSKFS